jgi:hypothetical protein
MGSKSGNSKGAKVQYMSHQKEKVITMATFRGQRRHPDMHSPRSVAAWRGSRLRRPFTELGPTNRAFVLRSVSGVHLLDFSAVTMEV